MPTFKMRLFLKQDILKLLQTTTTKKPNALLKNKKKIKTEGKCILHS